MSEELIENAEFGKKKKNEEDPILVAQRYLNIYRQMHIFNKKRQDDFDQELLALSPEIKILLSTLPGGGLLLEHIEETEERLGISSTSAITKKASNLRKKENTNLQSNVAVNTSSANVAPAEANLAVDLSSLSMAIQQTEQRYKEDMQTLTKTITDTIMESQLAMANMMKEVLFATRGINSPISNDTLSAYPAYVVPQQKNNEPKQNNNSGTQNKQQNQQKTNEQKQNNNQQQKQVENKAVNQPKQEQAKQPQNNNQQQKQVENKALNQSGSFEPKPAQPVAQTQTKAPENTAANQPKPFEPKPAQSVAQTQAKTPENIAANQPKPFEPKPAQPVAQTQAKTPENIAANHPKPFEPKPAQPVTQTQVKAPENNSLIRASDIVNTPADSRSLPQNKPIAPDFGNNINKPADKNINISFDEDFEELLNNSKPNNQGGKKESTSPYLSELNQIKSALQSESDISDKNKFVSLDDFDDVPISLDDFDDLPSSLNTKEKAEQSQIGNKLESFSATNLTTPVQNEKNEQKNQPSVASADPNTQYTDDEEWEWEYTEDDGNSEDWEWEYVEDDGNSEDWEWEYVEEE